ncbi:MAG: hypothetical protein SPL00_01725 [Bacilli bacterium]|nr:hypothetical protein [Bacilli bacterium]
MSKKTIYILMYKDYEVLSFTVDLRKKEVKFIEKKEYFDKAPYGFLDNEDSLDNKIKWFFSKQAIPVTRKGYREILKATHCKSGFNLLFKGHGLSLSNHYWFKKEGENLSYKDINFFSNKWDDSFAREVIKENYAALSKVSLEVPDIATAGWGVKGWLYDLEKGPRLYKLGIQNNSDEVLGEVLASKLAKKLLKEEEVVGHDLEVIYGKYASVSSPMIGLDEVLIPLSNVLPLEFYKQYLNIKLDRNNHKKFLSNLLDQGYKDLYLFFIKIACLRSLCFINDLHFDNISMIKNMNSGELRIAPIYDLGGSFGTSGTAKNFIQNRGKSTLLLIYFAYGNLDPEWDYSWYNKDNLIGFESTIREILGKSEFFKDDVLDFAMEIYAQQKSSLDKLASKENK